MKCIFRQIKGSLNVGLYFKPKSLALFGYFDLDWARGDLDRWTPTGFIVYLWL